MKRGMIPIFIPHVGCPHICVFCNQQRIANTSIIPDEEIVKKTIAEYMGFSSFDEAIASMKTNRENESNQALTIGKERRFWEVAFYGGSFTAVNENLQLRLLGPAKKALDAGLIQGIRCSTRPDALGDKEILRLKKYGVTTVEIGVQSMDDYVLIKAKRGHSAKDVREAVARLREHGFTIGLQLMPGLPGDSKERIEFTTEEVTKLKPDFVRIYPVLVIEDTELGDDYRAGKYIPLSKEEALEYCAYMKTYFEEHHINVIRTGLQATEALDKGEALLAGPYSPSFGEEVVNRQVLHKLQSLLDQYTIMPKEITISYHRSLTSKVRGLKRANMIALEHAYGHRFIWVENKDLPKDVIYVTIDKDRVVLNCP